jgi:hypothetical protein
VHAPDRHAGRGCGHLAAGGESAQGGCRP